MRNSYTTQASASAHRLRRDTRGEAGFSYAALAGLLAVAGLVGLTQLGGAFGDAVSGGVRGEGIAGATASRITAPTATVSSAAAAGSLANLAKRLGGMADEAGELWGYANTLLREPQWAERVGFSPVKAVLVEGADGSGKTRLVREVAAEAGVNFIPTRVTDLIDLETPPGVERKLEALFARAKAEGPSIIFLDQLEELQGLAQMNVPVRFFIQRLEGLLESLTPADRVLVVGATQSANELSHLAPTLRRTGRFERRITLGARRTDQLAEMLRVHTRRMKLEDDVDLAEVARQIPETLRDAASAELLAQEAGRSALRRYQAAVDAGELKRPRAARAAKVPDVELPELAALPSQWTDPGEIADFVEHLTTHYAIASDPPDFFQNFVTQLRGLADRGEGLPGPLAPQLIDGLTQAHAQAAAGTLPSAAAGRALVEHAEKARLRAAKAKGTFPVSRADFQEGLEFLQRNAKHLGGQYL